MASPGSRSLVQHDYSKPVTGLTKSFMGDPLDDARAVALGATSAKNQTETQKMQAEQAGIANLQAAIRAGVKGAALLPYMAFSSSFLGEAPKINLLQQSQLPGATPRDMTVPMLGAGSSYGSTPEGTEYVQGQENKRSATAASIAAAPHFAQVAENKRQFEVKPVPIYDPVTNTTTWQTQGTLATNPPPGVPFSPEVYTGMQKPQDFQGPGQQTVQTPLWRYSQLPPIQLSPVPPALQVEREKPIPAIQPGATTPTYTTQGDVTKGGYQPPVAPEVTVAREKPMAVTPPEGGPPIMVPQGAVSDAFTQNKPYGQAPPPTAPPAPEKVGANELYDIYQTSLMMAATQAGQDPFTFTGTKDNPTPRVPIPENLLKAMPEIQLRAAELYQANKDMGRSVAQAMNEKLGGPQDWHLTIPATSWIGRQLFGNPTLTTGQTNYTGPQVTRDPTNVRVQPPAASRTPNAPTISVRGNPAPPPAAAPVAPPAPAPAPSPTAVPKPNASDDAILTDARNQIARNPAMRPAIIKQVQDWGMNPAGL
jgi:hypothetical protein